MKRLQQQLFYCLMEVKSWLWCEQQSSYVLHLLLWINDETRTKLIVESVVHSTEKYSSSPFVSHVKVMKIAEWVSRWQCCYRDEVLAAFVSSTGRYPCVLQFCSGTLATGYCSQKCLHPHPLKGHKEGTWQWVHRVMYILYSSTINSLQTDIHKHNQISACHTHMPHAKAFGNQFVLEINKHIC